MTQSAATRVNLFHEIDVLPSTTTNEESRIDVLLLESFVLGLEGEGWLVKFLFIPCETT